MELFLVISLFIPVIIIGYYVSKLDNFMKKGGFKDPGETERAAIILGNGTIAEEVAGILQSKRIQAYRAAGPVMAENKRGHYDYLFALSDNDADNIVVCKICKKVYSVEKIISLCNDRLNEALFMSEGIPFIHGRYAKAEELCRLVTDETEAGL